VHFEARLVNGLTDQFGDMVHRVRRHGVREILDYIETTVAPEGADADEIESGIEQVLAVRGRAHQNFEGALDAGRLGDIFSGAVEGQRAHIGDPLKKGGLAHKLMFEAPIGDHAASMPARRLEQAFIHEQRRNAGLLAAVVNRFEERGFGCGVFIGPRRRAWVACGLGGTCLRERCTC